MEAGRTMITWQRYEKGYECSSSGDRRFSAFYARMPDGRTIEQHYQCDVKGYDPGGTEWRLGKGKPPLYPVSEEVLYQRYSDLWRVWALTHEKELGELYQAAGPTGVLTDIFATTPINQARALADILNEKYK